MKKLVMLAVGAVALPLMSQAATINFDMNSGSSATYTGVGAAPDAGTFWNGVSIDSGTTTLISISDALDSAGASTGVGLTMTRNDTEAFRIYSDGSSGNPTPGDLMQEYTYWDGYEVTLTGLAAGTYNLYMYGHGNAEGQSTTFTLNPANGGDSASTSSYDATDFRNTTVAGEGYTWVKLTGTVDGSGILAVGGNQNDDPDISFSFLNGFQVEAIPEPATIGLVGLFGGGLLLLRRNFKI